MLKRLNDTAYALWRNPRRHWETVVAFPAALLWLMQQLTWISRSGLVSTSGPS